MGRPRVRITKRVLTEHKVEIIAPVGEFFIVEDFIEFGKQLDDMDAPKIQGVNIVSKDDEKGIRRIKQLTVSWSEDLIDGQPTPQAMEEPHAQ